jgi:small subunit ribosomal protein S27Ae
MKTCYAVKDGKLVRTNPFCPRCGHGVFMADKGEWWSCGKCGDRYNKRYVKSSIDARESTKEMCML